MRCVAVGVSGGAGAGDSGTEAQGREDGSMRGRLSMRKITELMVKRSGLVLLRKPVRRVDDLRVIREASTGRVVAVLPQVWAVAEEVTAPSHEEDAVVNGPPDLEEEPKPELAFYRKYTEGMLRRYLRLSMEAGRVPSLLGRELFRGNVTSYRVKSFEDVVIFCYDVEKRLGRLRWLDQQLVKRVALQEYTQGEAAGMLGLSLRSCAQQYGRAIDRLTKMFLAARMLEPLKTCQGPTLTGNETN
jgi:hypothetical protein